MSGTQGAQGDHVDGACPSFLQTQGSTYRFSISQLQPRRSVEEFQSFAAYSLQVL
jgi:hypothetical protein